MSLGNAGDMKYDFTVIGRWRNRDFVNQVRDAIRAEGFSCYSFTDNDWSHHGAIWQTDDIEKTMSNYEKLPHDDPRMKEIFAKDLEGLRSSAQIVLVLPAGSASLMESGIAFGLGKPLYAVGDIGEKSETLFNIVKRIFPTLDEFQGFLEQGAK
jgi:nucleoside 2-deoxyribosyltransferase